jgi:hypothetical protein
LSTILDTWTITITPLVTTKTAKITTIWVTYYEKGAKKIVNVTNGGSINADVNTDISIQVTYQNTGTATLRALPWIVLYKEYKDPSTIWLQGYPIECGGTTLSSAPPATYYPISVNAGATATNTFPTFKMPSNKLIAEVRVYDYDTVYAYGAVTPLGIDIQSLLSSSLSLIILVIVLSVIVAYVGRVAKSVAE